MKTESKCKLVYVFRKGDGLEYFRGGSPNDFLDIGRRPSTHLVASGRRGISSFVTIADRSVALNQRVTDIFSLIGPHRLTCDRY